MCFGFTIKINTEVVCIIFLSYFICSIIYFMYFSWTPLNAFVRINNFVLHDYGSTARIKLCLIIHVKPSYSRIMEFYWFATYQQTLCQNPPFISGHISEVMSRSQKSSQHFILSQWYNIMCCQNPLLYSKDNVQERDSGQNDISMCLFDLGNKVNFTKI